MINKKVNNKYFVVTVDTESDDAWLNPDKIKLDNFEEIPRFQNLCEKYNIIPTYLLTYEYAVYKPAVEFFKRNETIYFMCFRFAGGGGTPFPIQNVLPAIFNMSVKNYIIATFIGIIPTTFVTAALGSGIEKIIDQNAELNFFSAFLSPEIYLPIVGFFTLLLIALLLKNRIFK